MVLFFLSDNIFSIFIIQLKKYYKNLYDDMYGITTSYYRCVFDSEPFILFYW